MWHLLQTNLFFLLFTSGLLGLIIGSFLNVVIYRLPLMLQQQWQSQCELFLKLKTATELKPPHFNLFLPKSHCPHCQKTLTIWQNIPLISYLLLKGTCFHCKKKISLRYPLVEFTSAVLAVFVSYHFGFSIYTIAALCFSWILLTLFFIDVEHQLLPDQLTLMGLWLGLAFNAGQLFSTTQDAIFGTIAGYLTLWLVATTFKYIRRKEGMGHGDFKLLAMLGAWVGWQLLPLIILLSSLSGVITGLLLITFKKHQPNLPFAFGPHLAIAGWVALFWGNDILQRLSYF